VNLPRTLLTATIVAALAVAALPAAAGTVSIAWDPVADTDLAGYRVYSGTSAGNYSQSVDVGNVTATTLDLADCQTWYIAVKAYDAAGNESLEYSNEISGWARPRVAAVTPSAAEAGRTLDLTLDGANYQAGAIAEFANAGIVVNAVTVLSCNQLRVNVTIASGAAAGATNVDAVNPDRVYGTGVGAFTVQAAVAPQVSSTAPADGATNVAASVKPTVTFSEAMLASSIGSGTVRLLQASGSPVAQAAGSPSLSADGRVATITPAAALAAGQTYRIEVVGGASGVKDLANNAMASTYRHGTGFTIAPDQAAPTITDVAAGNVASTTARITWTTNEPADGRVHYRRASESAWQQTDLDPALVTAHAADLAGLVPSSTYEYYVRSADAGGNATDSATETFSTSANGFTYIRIEAESGTTTSPVRKSSGSGTFATGYVDTPAGTPPGSASAPAGTVTHGFHAPAAATWKVWLRMYGPTTSADSWFESVDGAARQAVFPSATGRWMWVAARSYTLAAGLHTLELGGSEAEARVDRILITDDPSFVPTEQPVGDQTAPAPVGSLTGTPGNQKADLSWTNPSSDYGKTVIRYRTDGIFPSNPFDGLPVTERSAGPGVNDTYTHSPLTNGVTYSYSVFTIDAAGHASPASSVSVTPQGNTRPPKVENTRRTDKKPK
jgi:hypothetical protein